MNSITVVVEKLKTISATETYTISAVRSIRADREIVVNRIAEEEMDGFTCARLAVACYAPAFEESEAIGAAVIASIGDGEMWGLGDIDDIEFEKLPSDVTGFDETRQAYVRAIEVAVKW